MFRSPLFRMVAGAALASSVVAAGLVAGGAVSSAAPRPTKPAPLYDISIGDSYSVGYQNPSILNSRGFTGYVAAHEHMQLVNFGCSGATTTSIFTQTGCSTDASAPAASGGVAYPTSDQVDAVLYFINEAANHGRIGLVTVSIGGNDVTSCARGGNPIPCVVTAKVLAAQSIVAFDDLINPTLQTAYTSVARGTFVDVTSAPYKWATAGDDTGSFNSTTDAYTGPTRSILGIAKNAPASVAEVCDLTWYCQSATFGDIHANTRGYNFIGGLVVDKLASL